MSRRSIGMLAGVATLAVLIVGCGGGGESLTKAEFIKQSDAICEKGKKEVLESYAAFSKSNGIKTGDVGPKAMRAEFGKEVYLPSVEKRIDAIRALDPPSADQEKVEAILTAVEDGVATAKKNVTVLFLPSSNPFNRKSKSLTEAYGFKVCGIA